jgi:CHAD domain-containing protein
MSHRKRMISQASAAELFGLVTLRLATDRLATDRLATDGHRAANQAEAVHQLRVNLRKARTALRLFEPLLPRERYRTADRRLRAEAHRYDMRRDLDVLRHEILPRLLPVVGGTAQKKLAGRIRAADRAAARPVTPDRVTSERITAVVSAAGPRLHSTRASRLSGRKFLHQRLDSLTARARRRLRRSTRDDRSALHRLRIALKQLRDAQLLSRDFLPRRQRIDLAPLRRATAALGELQDLERARVLLTGFVREDPRHAEAVTAAVLRLENLHRAAAPEALRLARRALGKSARKS